MVMAFIIVMHNVFKSSQNSNQQYGFTVPVYSSATLMSLQAS